jgi:hypothetical protein
MAFVMLSPMLSIREKSNNPEKQRSIASAQQYTAVAEREDHRHQRR